MDANTKQLTYGLIAYAIYILAGVALYVATVL